MNPFSRKGALAEVAASLGPCGRPAHQADRFPDDLAYVLVAAVDEARQLRGVLQAMALVQEGDSLKSPAMSERFRAAAQDVVRPYLLWAQERGEMRADLSVEETVRWLTQVCYSWLYLAEDESPAKLLEVCKTTSCPRWWLIKPLRRRLHAWCFCRSTAAERLSNDTTGRLNRAPNIRPSLLNTPCPLRPIMN